MGFMPSSVRRHPQVIRTVHGIGYRLEHAARAERMVTG